MRKGNPKINIMLGVKSSSLKSNGDALNATIYRNFYAHGFVGETDIITTSDYAIWMPLVAETIKKSRDNGGKIFIQLEDLTDISALYNKNSPYYNGGTVTEIRYIVDNGLWDNGFAEFRLGKNRLSDDMQKEMNEAINKWKELRDTDPREYSWKGKFNINY